MCRIAFVQRQFEPEHGAFAQRAFHAEGCVMRQEDLFADGKAQAASDGRAPVDFVHFVVSVPDLRDLLLGNAFPAVLHVDADGPVAKDLADPDGQVVCGIVDGVVVEILNDLQNEGPVCPDEGFSGRFEQDLVAFMGSQLFISEHDFGDEGGQVEPLQLQRPDAGFQSG